MIFYWKFGLIALWFALVTPVFALAALPLWGNTSLSWAYARILSRVSLWILRIRVRVSGRHYLRGGPAVIPTGADAGDDLFGGR